MYYLVLVFAIGNIKLTVSKIETMAECKKIEARLLKQAPEASSEGCKKYYETN